jgi:hypothetical protein
MQAPQSQVRSEVHGRRSQWCGDGEVALQSVFGGHWKPPPTHETAEQPFGVRLGPGAHVYPAGQA